MINVIDVFPAIICGSLFLLFLISVIAFCFGIAYGAKNADAQMLALEDRLYKERVIAVQAAMDEGIAKGIADSKPKHDARGRFTH